MNWYVLQVLTGKEEEIARKLGQRGIESLVPKEHITLHKGGEWLNQTRLLLPGYVLIHTNYSPTCYYTFHAILGIIRILGNMGKPVPLTSQEEAYWTQGDWMPSRVHQDVDGGWDILDGPLLRVPDGQIIKISPRQHRARVQLTVGAITLTKDLAIQIV